MLPIHRKENMSDFLDDMDFGDGPPPPPPLPEPVSEQLAALKAEVSKVVQPCTMLTFSFIFCSWPNLRDKNTPKIKKSLKFKIFFYCSFYSVIYMLHIFKV